MQKKMIGIVTAVLAVFIGVVCIDVFAGIPQLKKANGEEVAYSVDKTDVSASEYYDMLDKDNGDLALYRLFSKAVIEQSVETTDELEAKAKSYEDMALSYYASTNPENYKEALDTQLKSSGYLSDTALHDYMLDRAKSEKMVQDYIYDNLEALKIRKIAYLLVQFDGDNTEPHDTPTEAEQAKLDAVDAAFAEGKEFSEIASKYSEDSSTAGTGGELGFIDINTANLDTAFTEAALALKEGETSDWVYSENFGWFRIKNLASTKETIEKLQAENTDSDIFESLVQENDPTLYSNMIWESAEKIGFTFTDEAMQERMRTFVNNPI